MAQPDGRKIPLSLPRRFVRDLMTVCRRVPLIPMSRRMQLGDLVRARSAAQTRIGWCALFLKAYAIVARRTPELRRLLLSFPYSRLYEHPLSVASLTVSREYRGEQAVFFGHVRAPDQQTLTQIDDYVRHLQQAPLESIGLFRRTLSLARVPGVLRRAMWWYAMKTTGLRRVKYFGTFGLSTVGGLGATLESIISPCSTTLSYGPIADDGSLDVRLIFDHRVLDGAPAADVLADLEAVLTGEIIDELDSLQQREPPESSDMRRAA